MPVQIADQSCPDGVPFVSEFPFGVAHHRGSAAPLIKFAQTYPQMHEMLIAQPAGEILHLFG
jgi:hypothetical protein